MSSIGALYRREQGGEGATLSLATPGVHMPIVLRGELGSNLELRCPRRSATRLRAGVRCAIWRLTPARPPPDGADLKSQPKRSMVHD
jgi:hypothetical protein